MPRMTSLDTLQRKSAEELQWDQWLDGTPWSFDKGIDYVGSQDSFIKHVRYQARKRGLRVNLIQRTDVSFTIVACQPENTS